MEKEEEKKPVLVNKCYGRFGLSDEIYDEYEKKYKKINPNFGNREMYETLHDPYIRTNNLLIELVKKYGEKANDIYSKIKIEYIPKKYEKAFYIYEYDGMESIRINYDKYRHQKLKDILYDTNIDDSERVLQMKFFIENKN